MSNNLSNMNSKNDVPLAKDWLEEVIDFTSNLSRQMQATLGRIKVDFLRRGMQFDADFRDHFLFIVNNRWVFMRSAIFMFHSLVNVTFFMKFFVYLL